MGIGTWSELIRVIRFHLIMVGYFFGKGMLLGRVRGSSDRPKPPSKGRSAGPRWQGRRMPLQEIQRAAQAEAGEGRVRGGGA